MLLFHGLAVALHASGVWLHGLAVVIHWLRFLWLHGLLLCQCSRCVASWLAVVPVLQVCGALWLAVVLPPSSVGSLEASGRILQPGTQAGARTHSSVRRRSRLDSSLSGFFLIGYCSICQLFKFSYRMLHAKVFRGENFIKTLFSINYRGYFIIQATHSTINYSYFLHKTDRKHVENQ